MDDLARTVSLPIRHLSTYALSIEEGTAFLREARRGSLHLPSEEGIAMFSLCRHNLLYWGGRARDRGRHPFRDRTADPETERNLSPLMKEDFGKRRAGHLRLTSRGILAADFAAEGVL